MNVFYTNIDWAYPKTDVTISAWNYHFGAFQKRFSNTTDKNTDKTLFFNNLMADIKGNSIKSLQLLEFHPTPIQVNSLAGALKENTSLEVLEIEDGNISSEDVSTLMGGIKDSKLHSLSLNARKINNCPGLVDMLKNSSLQYVNIKLYSDDLLTVCGDFKSVVDAIEENQNTLLQFDYTQFAHSQEQRERLQKILEKNRSKY